METNDKNCQLSGKSVVRVINEQNRNSYGNTHQFFATHHTEAHHGEGAWRRKKQLKGKNISICNYKKGNRAMFLVILTLAILFSGCASVHTTVGAEQEFKKNTTPWEWTSTVRVEDVDSGVWISEQPESEEFTLTQTQIEFLTSILNNVQQDEVYPGRGFPMQRCVTLYCGKQEYHLSFYDSETIVISFDSETASRYPIDTELPAPSWEIHNEALGAFLDGLTEETE